MWLENIKLVLVALLVSIATHQTFAAFRAGNEHATSSAHSAASNAPSTSRQRASAVPPTAPQVAAQTAPTQPTASALRADNERSVGELRAEITSMENKLAALERKADPPELRESIEANRAHREWLVDGKQQARSRYEADRRKVGSTQFAHAEQSYNAALDLEREGKHSDVIARMDSVAQSVPGTDLAASALMVKGYEQRRAGDLQGALQTAEQVSHVDPQARSLDGQLQAARGLVLRAEVCRDSGDVTCLQQSHDQLAERFAEAMLPSGSTAVQYVAGLF